MIIEKVFPSGAYRVSDIIDNVRVSRLYMGYTKREALKQFKAEMEHRAQREMMKQGRTQE